MASGRCFETTVEMLLDFPPGTSWRVAHGIPLRRGGEAKGLRYWHAWLESDSGFCIDGNTKALIPRDQYYQLGNIDPDQVWYFTRQEMGFEIAEHEHYGPWVDDWEDLVQMV